MQAFYPPGVVYLVYPKGQGGHDELEITGWQKRTKVVLTIVCIGGTAAECGGYTCGRWGADHGLPG